jgi:DNA-binding GntR family transcriptional regulator
MSRPKHVTPLSEVVLRQLRREILAGTILPGDRLRQEEIARRCGTSRIPVREALKQLESEGLVSLTSNVGARVSFLDQRELEEVYLIREQLEPFAIRVSTPNLTEEDMDAVRQALERLDGVANVESNPSEWIKLDRDFHFRTYAGVGLPRLLTLIEGLWDSTQQYRRAYVRLPERLAVAQEEHREIVLALERRDWRRAQTMSLRHIRRTRLELERRPELFNVSHNSA